MLRMAERVSDRLVARFVEKVDAGACVPPDFCYCRPQACPVGQPCPGARFNLNCVGRCVYRGNC